MIYGTYLHDRRNAVFSTIHTSNILDNTATEFLTVVATLCEYNPQQAHNPFMW